MEKENIISKWLNKHGDEEIRLITEKRLKTMKDLQIFKTAFLSDKYKDRGNKLEYRSQNIDIAVPQARKIIEALNLNLEVVSTGQMAQYKSFEVIIKGYGI